MIGDRELLKDRVQKGVEKTFLISLTDHNRQEIGDLSSHTLSSDFLKPDGRSQVTIKSSVLRGSQPMMLPSERVVPGDVVVLSAGSLIPADGIVLEANDFFVNQAVLTGETFPVEKKPGTVPANASLAQRTNCVFMGTNAGSGSAQVLIVQTGKATVFGQGRNG